VTRIDAVLFDWGDTLFESPHAPTVIVSHAKQQGVIVSDDDAQRMWDELWDVSKTREEHAKGRDLSRDAHRRVWTELFSRKESFIPGIGRVLYQDVMDPSSWRPYPDTAPTLGVLRERGIRIGVVSNTAHDLRDFFKRARLERYIDAFTFSYEVGVAKPARKIFAVACERLGVPPANTLMVGDDAVSDGGAADAGLQLYLLGPYAHGQARGLARVVQIVDASRARDA
jgi:HAD superfamily hydrolase (TIGR01509 family)